MRYLVSVIDHQTNSGTPAETAAIDAFNDELKRGGYWVLAAGVAPPSEATVIDNRDGKGLFTGGPFVVSREYVSGFWIIDAPNDQVARELAARGSQACNRRVEVRAFLGG